MSDSSHSPPYDAANASHSIRTEEVGDVVDFRPAEAAGAAAASQLSEYAFRRAIEQAVGAGLAACDLDGRQTYVNAAFCAMVGWSEAELVGAMPPFRYWPDEEHDTIEEAFRETAEKPGRRFELRFRRKGGERIDVQVATAPLVTDDGSTQGWVASVSNIRDRKEAERKVQRLNAELDVKARNLREAERKLAELIKDLQTYFQLCGPPGPFRRVDLNDIVDDALSERAGQIEEWLGDVVVDDLPALEADPAEIRQLFQHLISNGLKFHRESVAPVVWITCTEARLNDQDACRIAVSDNGVGFDVGYADHIVAPFQQLHDQNSFPGTGLGLAICRKIVERHRGEISAQSEPGEGTTFVVTLPYRQEQFPASAAE